MTLHETGNLVIIPCPHHPHIHPYSLLYFTSSGGWVGGWGGRGVTNTAIYRVTTTQQVFTPESARHKREYTIPCCTHINVGVYELKIMKT